MKQLSIICISLASLLGINPANATVHIITAYGGANERFSPETTNAVCGDTIKWVNGSGSHTVNSTTIPSGALPWSSGTLTTSGFMYVVTKSGTYNYTCHPSPANPAGHMPAKLLVTCATTVPSIDLENISFAYPIPFSNSITIEATDADMINLYNILGNKIKSVSFVHGQTKIEVDAAELPKGIYFYSVIREGEIVETRKLMKNE